MRNVIINNHSMSSVPNLNRGSIGSIGYRRESIGGTENNAEDEEVRKYKLNIDDDRLEAAGGV